MRAPRAVLSIVLIPILVSHGSSGHNSALIAAISGGLSGAALGLAASLIAGAASAAGALVDAGLTWAPLADRSVGGGAFAHLYQLGFALVLLQSGGLTALVGAVARASPHLHLGSLVSIELARNMFAWCLQLAAPALLSQVIASLLAGIVSRAAPAINGMLMSAPLVSAAVLLAVAGGSVAIEPLLLGLVRASVSASHSVAP